MKSRQCGLILGSLACFVVINNHVEAGPVSRRLAREIYPELEQENDANQSQVCVVGDVVYGVDEMVPAEQPCLKCRCQPPSVICEATRCGNKKHGCKAVHRPNQCCPNYQCECEYNNKKYSNGERVEALPGDECKVCYCRGGEIQCTDVSCYVRNDCEGKQVQGQCCPKYDHCPTRDYLEKLASSSTNASTAFNFIGEEVIATLPEEQVTNHNSNKSQSQNDNGVVPVDPSKQGSSMVIPRISIQEVIPDTKDISTSGSHVKLEPVNEELIKEKKESSERKQNNEDNTNDLTATDSDAESSEIEEVIHNPPPVIRIGDNLLFLRKNELINEKDASSTPGSIITLIGAEGLQRGGIEEVVENITNADNFENTYPVDTAEDDINDLSSASSSHILSLVKKKKKLTISNESTTMVPTSIFSTTFVTISTSDTTQSSSLPLFSAEGSTFSQGRTSTSTGSPETMLQKFDQESSKTDASYSSTSVDQTGNIYLDIERNPAYPTIPDIITRYTDEGWIRVDSAGDLNQSSSTEKINVKESRILPEILEIRNNKTLPANVTHIEWLKSNYQNESALATFSNVSATSSSETLHASTEAEEEIEVEDQSSTPIIDSSTSAEWEEISTSTEPQLYPHLQLIKDVEEMNISEKENMTSKENLRSVEAIENSDEYSGEKTTPKDKNTAAMTSMENASIEGDKKESEVNDMLFVKEYAIDMVNDEERKKLNQPNNSTNSADVELINVSELEKSSTSSEIPEKLPTPEKVVLTDKTINKRENTPQDVDDAVFAELQKELGLGSTEKPKTPEEEELEAKKIFQELLEETSSPKPQKTSDVGTKDSKSLEKISQALTKLALNNAQPLDVGVLSVLKDFFASQYKAYESKSP